MQHGIDPGAEMPQFHILIGRVDILVDADAQHRDRRFELLLEHPAYRDRTALTHQGGCLACCCFDRFPNRID